MPLELCQKYEIRLNELRNWGKVETIKAIELLWVCEDTEEGTEDLGRFAITQSSVIIRIYLM